jgi:uncharacterized protein (DUF1778 family)
VAEKARAARQDALAPAHDEAEWRGQGWAETSAPLTANPRLEAIVSVRFGPDDAALLRRAARLSGRTRSEFIRRATIAAAEKSIAEERPAIRLLSVSVSADPPITGSPRARSVSEPGPRAPIGERSPRERVPA